MSGAPKQEPLSPAAVAFAIEASRTFVDTTRGHRSGGEPCGDCQADLARLFDAHRANAHASLVAALKTPWLIKNVESHVYWAANGHGYTADVDEAGRYSTEEASIHVLARTLTATVGVVKPFEAPAEVMIPSPEFLAALAGAQKGESRD